MIKALCCRGVVAARETDDARLEARVRKKVRADLAQARGWNPRFALLPSALADRQLCEYTRVLQLSTLEQRVYAGIEAEPAGPDPVEQWMKNLAWLAVVGLTLFLMWVPQPPARREPSPVARSLCARFIFPPPGFAA